MGGLERAPDIALGDVRRLSRAIERCMPADRPVLRRRLAGLQRAADQQRSVEHALGQFLAALQDSAARLAQRRQHRPVPTYPLDLPVVQRRDEIAAAIRQNQVVVLCGETGSGKTTQLPKICLELGRGVEGLIGHTQPRRIAARALATRIASELQTPLGHAVGYKVRFDDQLSEQTYIKVMTDGILLAETQHDRMLRQYDTILIDEAHERSLNIDFLLGYLRRLLPRRPDLKVIVTSATIDPQRFAEFFADRTGRPAPIIEVSGRTYPVEVRYRPLTSEDPEEADLTELEAIVRGVEELIAQGPGDILVFLPGEREIREVAEALELHHFPQKMQVLPLYARQGPSEQQRVFAPHAQRRVVLATNVAETSLTVPGIRYVIDPGLARISRYSARRRVQRLPIEAISQASANQRAGRCGRLSDGICLRLYTQQDFEQRPPFTDPEIHRANLASVILQMKSLELGRIEQFPFLDPPNLRTVRDGYDTLHELGAVDRGDALTPLGRKLARLPIDPRLGRMILAAHDEHVLGEVLIIASALAVQDPRDRPMDQRDAADQAHARFFDERSDFLALLKLWDFHHDLSRKLSRNQLRKACRQNFISYLRMREWHDVYQQLRRIVTETGMKLNEREKEPVMTGPRSDAVHRALMTGLLSNLAIKGEGPAFAGSHGKQVFVFPGSSLFKKPPKWVMAAEMVQTTRLFARTVASISPQWIEPLAQHLLERSYSEAHWDAQSGQVSAFEKVSLYGLVLVPRRRVSYGRIDPVVSRDLFIRFALVEADFPRPPQFLMHNQRVLNEARGLEAKRRRHDLVVDFEAMVQWYAQRLPAEMSNRSTLERWLKSQPRDALKLTLRDALRPEVELPSPQQFPDVMKLADAELPLEYRFQVGHDADGVTAIVPLAVLNQLVDYRFEWLVPGLLAEKVEAMLRGLPKALRRTLVPIPDFARKCLEAMRPYERPLRDALGDALRQLAGLDVPHDAWSSAEVPPHLLMNFRVLDAKGGIKGEGRDLAKLQQELCGEVTRSIALGSDDPRWRRDGITRWDFGDLPEHVQTHYAGTSVRGYPALVDHGATLSLRLLDSIPAAEAAQRAGVRRLFMLQVQRELKAVLKDVPQLDKAAVWFSSAGTAEQLREDFLNAVAQQALDQGEAPIRRQDEFLARAQEAWGRLHNTGRELGAMVVAVLEQYQAAASQLMLRHPAAWGPSVQEMRQHLATLVYPGFITATPPPWLKQLPRYVHTVIARIRKLGEGALDRDLTAMNTLAPLQQQMQQRRDSHRQRNLIDPALDRYRWMLEEYRVSLFAQQLGTAVPVSPQRLSKQWELVRS
jgi:ATP-dependent helicase HrpA